MFNTSAINNKESEHVIQATKQASEQTNKASKKTSMQANRLNENTTPTLKLTMQGSVHVK